MAQEVLLRLWQHPQLLDQPAPTLRPWLFAVARNLAYDELRCARRRHEFLTDDDGVPDHATPDPCAGLADTVVVERALSTLSHEHRLVIWYAYYAGANTTVIADKLAIPRGTVKSRLHYALRAFRAACRAQGVTAVV
ncbi:sigma-70 family RNA polymerase sigma factor [Nocardia sp. NPDC020380]|uniref:sigma-70 family RNA polymerase sigma factor n=1 Tax=Nocardia sp. NPDC020380 TaxID=3364309 RepID=UPI00378C83D9